MQSAVLQTPQLFLDSLTALYGQIERWAKTKGLHTQRGQVDLNEEAYGAYQAETLRLLTPAGKRIAELLPVGASIIGAKGRVDLHGTLDHATLVDWDAGGPSFNTSVIVDGHEETQNRSLYRGVGEAGWYWVESRKLARAHKLDEKLFFDLLLAVADHDFRD